VNRPPYMNVEWCAKHQAYRPAGDPCPQCAAPQEASGLREVVNTLKGFVDDLSDEVRDLRIRVSQLEHERGVRPVVEEIKEQRLAESAIPHDIAGLRDVVIRLRTRVDTLITEVLQLRSHVTELEQRP
jgi:predicted nuclease with TOPRIM domain